MRFRTFVTPFPVRSADLSKESRKSQPPCPVGDYMPTSVVGFGKVAHTAKGLQVARVVGSAPCDRRDVVDVAGGPPASRAGVPVAGEDLVAELPPLHWLTRLQRAQ
jgi:hypothetical protein